MKVSILEQSDEILKLLLEETNYNSMNKIRRFLYTDYGVYAPTKILVHKNDTNLSNPIAALKLGLVPIKNFLILEDEYIREYNQVDAPNEIKCTLNYTAIEDEEKLMSNYIELLTKYNERTGIFPCFEDIVLTELLKDQQIHIDIYYSKGIPSNHLKFRSCFISSTEELDDDKFIITIENYGIVSTDEIYNAILEYV